jgi:hypothetical protein
MGMMEQDPKSLYDLLLATPENTNSKSDSDGRYPLLRECNVLHLSEDGVAPTEDTEDDTYLIPRTTEEQAEYDQERHDHRCPSPQHLDAEGAQAQAHCVYDQIQ